MLSCRRFAALTVAAWLVGCGGGEGPPGRGEGGGKRGAAAPRSRRAASSANEGGAGSSVPAGAELNRPFTASARRTWDDFPLDAVFFGDPRAEFEKSPGFAANGEPTNANATGSAPAEGAASADLPERPALASTTNWSELLPTGALIAEVDEIRGRLKDHMARVEAYNGHYREVRVDAAVLAVLAGIVAREERDVAWKRQAVHVRDVAARLAKQADGLGPANFGPAQESYVKLEPLFGGKLAAAAGLDPEPIVDMPWINVADLSRLMQRMNTALEIRIKEAAADSAELRKRRQLVLHEATVLAALAAVIATSYDGSEDEEYRDYAARLKQEALGLRDAIEQGAFDAASQRIGSIGRSCKDCHDDYRFGDDF